MAHLVLKDNIISGGTLAPGQTLRLGGFVMTAGSALKPTMTSQVIKNRLRVDPEYSARKDPTELSSLNKLLDRMAALGVATDYDRVGLNPDQREIKTPPITHQIAVVEVRSNSSTILKTNYVWISDLEGPNILRQKGMFRPPNMELDDEPKKSVDILEPELPGPVDLQTLDPKSGQGSEFVPPTLPDTKAIMSIKQQSQEKVHHFWARFLLVKDKVKDCRDEDAISAFCKNCADEGILNAINCRCIPKFPDLATIVQKYCPMESTWETRAARWEPPAPTQLPLQAKRAYPRGTPSPTVKKHKAAI